MALKRLINISMFFFILLSYLYKTQVMKRDKNLKITSNTHEILKKYCEENGLKMFSYVEKIIREKCAPKKDIYGEN